MELTGAASISTNDGLSLIGWPATRAELNTLEGNAGVSAQSFP